LGNILADLTLACEVAAGQTDIDHPPAALRPGRFVLCPAEALCPVTAAKARRTGVLLLVIRVEEIRVVRPSFALAGEVRTGCRG
jgi:hypothetical protein